MARTAPFDRHAGRYDDWFERHRDAYLDELAALRPLLPPPPARGLEIGVGSGKFAAPLGVADGVEPSEAMARRAERLGIRVRRGTAEELPFADGTFDFALMVTTICFVDDIPRALAEARRVLKPAGALILGFVDRESALGRGYEAHREASDFYREATFVSAADVARYLADAGFHDATFRQALIPGTAPGTVEDGYGRGGFVAARGMKRG